MQEAGTSPQRSVWVNGRSYGHSTSAVAVICLDGWDPAYLTLSLAAGELPAISRCIAEGFHGDAVSAMPGFTNPNNFSIFTGVSPAVHGVSGNTYHDLGQLAGERLRSHGGLFKRAVPFLLSRPRDPAWRAAHTALRNHDIMDAALNGVQSP